MYNTFQRTVACWNLGTSKTLKPMIFQRKMNSSSQIPNNEKASSLVKAKSLFKANPTCFLCDSHLHPAYRCPITRLIRDKSIQIPLEFCLIIVIKFLKNAEIKVVVCLRHQRARWSIWGVNIRIGIFFYAIRCHVIQYLKSIIKNIIELTQSHNLFFLPLHTSQMPELNN